MNSKRVLVTGANGLIGRSLVNRLVKQGHFVVGLDRTNHSSESDLYHGVDVDLREIHSIYATFHQFEITHVVHCGAISGPMVARDRPHTICDINVTGTLNMLEAARVMQVQRFVFCSSASVYGQTPPPPVTEAAPLQPTDVYSATKAAGDLLVQAYAQQNHVDALALRISWVFGPYRQTDCLIRTLLENGRCDRPTELNWGIGFHRQYIYVEDVTTAILAALDAPSPSQRAYNITGGGRTSIEDVVRAVKSILPSVQVKLAPGIDPMDCIQEEFDISAAKRDLGFVPQYNLEQGVKAYFEWLCKK